MQGTVLCSYSLNCLKYGFGADPFSKKKRKYRLRCVIVVMERLPLVTHEMRTTCYQQNKDGSEIKHLTVTPVLD